MDLKTRKLNLISYFAQLQDEPFFDKIEAYILKKKETGALPHIPFSEEEYLSRIQKSEDDFKSGSYTSQEELEKITENW